jgi:signal transduction histidine kinase
VISGRTGHGPGGVLVVMAGLAGISRLTERFAGVAGAVLVLLAGATLALARAILRPLHEARRLAEATGQAAAGELLRANRAAEAAAGRPAAEMAERLGEVSLDIRTSVNVVRGFAAYYRERRPPPSASLDLMMRRVANEAARLETLVEDLAHAARTGATQDRPDLPSD